MVENKAETALSDIALATFVKTPALSPVKTRLAKGIGGDAALAFYELSWRTMAAVMEQCETKGFSPYWAVAEAEGLPVWEKFPTVWQGEGGLGARLALVYETLFGRYGGVCLIGADCPQMHAGIFADALERLERSEIVMGPAADGGFYLFASRVALPASVWHDVRYSCASTCDELETALRPYGKIEHLQKLTDVDEKQDLAVIEQELIAHIAQTCAQDITVAHIALLQWLKKRGL